MFIRNELTRTWSRLQRKPKMDSCVPGGDDIFFNNIWMFLSQDKAIPLLKIYTTDNLILSSDTKFV